MTVPKPYTPTIEKYPVRIYDDSFNLVAEIDDYISLVWTRRWRSAGEFELKVNRYSTGADQIEAGNWVSIYRAGIARIARIESMVLPLDENGKSSEVWTIRGTDAKGMFQQRISMVSVSAGTGYDTQTTVSAEAAMRHYIDGNLISATDAHRNISALELETVHSPELGGTVSYSARLETVAQILESLCLASPDQIGYDVVFLRDTKKLEYRTLKGTDRSSTLIFSTLIGNIGTISYSYDLTSTKNLAYVGDDGEDAARTFTEVYTGTEPAGIDRRELFIDGNDATTAAELTQAGTEALNENGIAESAEFTVLKDNTVHYSTAAAAGDFDLGDIITVVYGGIMTTSARIVELTEEYGTAGAYDDIKIVTGTLPNDIIRFLKLQDKKNSVRRRV